MGLECCLRLGISLTTRPKWLLGTARPPPGGQDFTLVASRSFSEQLCCKVLPYMELKAASLAPQKFQRRAQFPLLPFLPWTARTPWSVVVWEHSTFSSRDHFWNMYAQAPLILFRKLNWPQSPPKAKRRRVSQESRWPCPNVMAMPEGLPSKYPLLCPLGF